MNIPYIEPEGMLRKGPIHVRYTGSDAVIKGCPLFYDLTYGTAANVDALRMKAVIKGTVANKANYHFAGVASRNYDAKSGGQEIVIDQPGSVVEIPVLSNATINSTYFAPVVKNNAADDHATDHWYATPYPIRGRGIAKALQTKTAIINQTIDGSGAITTNTTLTKTGAFTNAAVGDYVYILGGGVAATGDAGPVAGRYTIATKTSNDAVVLDSSATNGVCSFIVVSGIQRVQAVLLDGDMDYGGMQFINPLDAVAVECKPAGFSAILGGGLTLGADSTSTFDDGEFIGQICALHAYGALTTSDYLVTLDTVGEQKKVLDEVTTGQPVQGAPLALASIAFDAASEKAILYWNGLKYREIASSGATLATS